MLERQQEGKAVLTRYLFMGPPIGGVLAFVLFFGPVFLDLCVGIINGEDDSTAITLLYQAALFFIIAIPSALIFSYIFGIFTAVLCGLYIRYCIKAGRLISLFIYFIIASVFVIFCFILNVDTFIGSQIYEMSSLFSAAFMLFHTYKKYRHTDIALQFYELSLRKDPSL